MTVDDDFRFYKARQAYFDKCEAFREEVCDFFENYKPKHKTQTT